MNVDWQNVKEYLEDRNNNWERLIYKRIIIIAVLVICVIVFCECKKVNLFYENSIVVVNDNVIMNVSLKDINTILNNKKLIIENEIYYYKVYNIELSNDNMFYNVYIRIKLDNLFINNNIINYKIKLKEEKIINCIIRIIKGE